MRCGTPATALLALLSCGCAPRRTGSAVCEGPAGLGRIHKHSCPTAGPVGCLRPRRPPHPVGWHWSGSGHGASGAALRHLYSPFVLCIQCLLSGPAGLAMQLQRRWVCLVWCLTRGDCQTSWVAYASEKSRRKLLPGLDLLCLCQLGDLPCLLSPPLAFSWNALLQAVQALRSASQMFLLKQLPAESRSIAAAAAGHPNLYEPIRAETQPSNNDATINATGKALSMSCLLMMFLS